MLRKTAGPWKPRRHRRLRADLVLTETVLIGYTILSRSATRAVGRTQTRRSCAPDPLLGVHESTPSPGRSRGVVLGVRNDVIGIRHSRSLYVHVRRHVRPRARPAGRAPGRADDMDESSSRARSHTPENHGAGAPGDLRPDEWVPRSLPVTDTPRDRRRPRSRP